MPTVYAELSKLSPTATEILKLVLTHGGDMRHGDIVKLLPESTAEAQLKQAFAECTASFLLWDKWPSAFDQFHTWHVSPVFREELAKSLLG